MTNNFLYIQKWLDSGLIPTDGLVAWHAVVPGETGNDIVYDYSGNNRNASCSPTGAPTAASSALNDRAGMYFGGSNNALIYTGAVAVKHLFCLCSYEDAAFPAGSDGYKGIYSGTALGALLLGNQGTNKMCHQPDNDPYTFYYNSEAKSSADETAPVSGNFAVLEQRFTNAVNLAGLQIGQDRNNSARKWKGWFINALAFSRILTETEIARIYLFYNLFFRSRVTPLDLPLVFPAPQTMGLQGYFRFLDAPENFEEITSVHTYQDKSRSFNESADAPPLRWEVVFNLSDNQGKDALLAKRLVFDDFNRRAGISQPFTFTDKYGTVWEDVRIESYDRNHEGHRSWRQAVKFNLVKYP